MAKSKKKITGKIILEGLDSEFDLSKISEIDLSTQDKEFIYFDRLDDGSWRLCYTKRSIPDLTSFEGLKIVKD